MDLSFSEQKGSSDPDNRGFPFKDNAQWNERSISEKMKRISAVAVLRFKEEEDRLMAAYVDKTIAIDKGVQVPLAVGERVKKSDYYAKGSRSANRDGILLMYVGNPPKEMEGAYLYDSRLIAYGDMPLQVFLKKLEADKVR